MTRRTQDVVLGAIRSHPGIISRDIAASTGLTKGRISQIVAQLRADGAIAITAERGRRGLPIWPIDRTGAVNLLRRPWGPATRRVEHG